MQKKWNNIDSADDLNRLQQLIPWEDAELVEVYGRSGREDFFPPDVCLSGYSALNYRLLYRVATVTIKYAELVFVHCEAFSDQFFAHPFFHGVVDSLKRVEILDRNNSLVLRCARMMYRFFEHELDTSVGFLAEQSLKHD